MAALCLCLPPRPPGHRLYQLAVLNPVGQLIGAGGPVIVVLLGMSILALTVVVAKVWQFASLTVALMVLLVWSMQSAPGQTSPW